MANPTGRTPTQKPSPEGKTNEDPLALLRSFTRGATNYVSTVCREVQSVAAELGDDFDRDSVAATSKVVCAQMERICDYTLQQAGRLSESGQREVAIFIHSSAGVEMTEGGTRVAKMGMKKFGTKLLNFILDNLREIKKLLLGLTDLILRALGLSFPQWLIDLLKLLDEFVDNLLKNLLELLGGNAEEFARKSSDAECRYLREIRMAMLLKQASREPLGHEAQTHENPEPSAV